MHDYIIRGGTIFDGSRAPGATGDVAVRDGVIVAVGGAIREPAREVIDADGAIVTPAWIDIHTHYDGQVTWDSEINPSASHGVGTIVMGNCGVGFAPVPPGGHADLIDVMEGVEDIPGTALYDGMPWGAWETFPQYLDYLAGREYALNVSAMVPHAAVRNYVMGERGRANAAATADDIAQMAEIVEDAMRAGAVGFSTSRIPEHRTIHGQKMPGTTAEEAELVAVADAMRRSGSGVIQAILSETIAKGHQTQEAEVEMLCRLSAASGRPGTFTLIQKASQPDRWRELVDLVKQRNAAGSQVHPQVGSRPAGLVFSLASYHPFMTKPSYVALKHLPFEQRLAAMRDPEVKARILSEPVPRFDSLGKMENNIAVLKLPMERTFALDANFTYEPSRDESFEALAQKAGYEDGLSYFYDYLVSGDGRNFAMTFFSSYGRHNLNHIYEMQLDDTCVVGLSDGGAHVGLIFDAVAPTYQLTYWARDRRRGETLPLEHVIHKQTRRNAELFGFKDRGALAPGMRADVNVIDFENLRLGEIQFHHDLPGGGSRLLQGASGYLATMVNGQVTRRHDADTGARPGRLLRGEAA